MHKHKKLNLFVNNVLIGQYDLRVCCMVANGIKGLKSMSFIEGYCCFIDTRLQRRRQMEIIESTDHFLQDIYRVEDEGRLVAICYRMKDAEVAKAAFEKAKEEEADKACDW